MNTYRAQMAPFTAQSRWLTFPPALAGPSVDWRGRTNGSVGRAATVACRGSGRSGTNSSRRDVSSVNPSAVDARVSEVEMDVEGQDRTLSLRIGADDGAGVLPTPSARSVVTTEDDVDAAARPSSSFSASSSTSFQCHEETCYTTNSPDSSFTSINDAKYQLKFLVPNSLSGCIIGKKGANLERIQAQSGAFIQANAPGFAVQSHRQRFIIIAGDSMKQCLHGLLLLLQSVKEADKLDLLKANVHEEDPRLYLRQVIPGSCAGNIIGVKGGNLARISRERGLSVFVEPKPMHATMVPFRIVSYAGSSLDQLVGGVQGVIDELQREDVYMDQYMAEIKEIKSVAIKVVRVPSGRVGALIGPKGSHLQALQEVLKCRMSLSKSAEVEEDDHEAGSSAQQASQYASGGRNAGHYYLTVWGQPDNVRAAVAVAKLQGGDEVARKPKQYKESKDSKESVR